MTQFVVSTSLMQATFSTNNYNILSYGFPRNPSLCVDYNNKSCLYHGNFVKLKRYGGFSSSLLGSFEGISNADDVGSSCKAKVFDREEVFPPIQTLRRFPIKELFSKVVMVRFDSSILLQQKRDHQNSINSSAFFTIKYLYKAGAKVVLMSSWTVKRNAKVLSKEAVAEFLASVLQLKVVAGNYICVHQKPILEQFEQADVILLENLSKCKQDLANDSEFSSRLASGVDIYVNDAFSTIHKILASTVGVTRYCSACLAGFYFEECLDKLKKIPECSRSSCVAVVGGGNITDKALALRFLATNCDGLVFVGKIAFQIMHALGIPVPLNMVEQEGIKEALEIVKFAKNKSIPILLPSDFWCKHGHLDIPLETFYTPEILDGWEPVDLGPSSFIEIASFLSGRKNIIWIGPLKFKDSDEGTGGACKLAFILDELGQNDCHITIIGQAACEGVSRISSSPSAYELIEHASVVWEYLKGRKIPGLLALDRAYAFEIDWNTIYLDPTQPLAVDIGSGNGLFLLGMAKMRKDLNFLGLEMNEKLVVLCLQSAQHSGLKNLHFIATNATFAFHTIVSSYPGPVNLVSILCPNPDFNQPEHRWSMVQRSLVEAIADELAPGGKVFLQSDVEEVALRMRKQFVNEGKRKFAIVCDDNDATLGSEGWLTENPFGVRSDWERHVLDRGAPMYRLLLCKNISEQY